MMTFVGSSSFFYDFIHAWACEWPWKQVDAQREEAYYLGLLSLRRVNAGKEGQTIP